MKRADLSIHFDIAQVGGRVIYVHKECQLRFVEVPAGKFLFGLSRDDIEKANALGYTQNLLGYDDGVLFPATEAVVPSPILVSETPITDVNLVAAGCNPFALMDLDYHFHVSSIKYGVATGFCQKYSFRLLTEREWEYCTRGGSASLFPWGDDILDDSVLDAWMDYDTSDMLDAPSNGFGLKYLFNGDGCADLWSRSGSLEAPEPGNHVIKGGASQFWPWQGDGWVFAIPAMRQSQSDSGEEKFAFRVALDLD